VADPFAPPSDVPRRRRAPSAAPPPTAPAYDLEPAMGSDPVDRQAAPAHAGPFWLVAAIGVGLLCLGRLLLLLSYITDLEGEMVAPALFDVFGVLALAIGLVLAALLQRGLSTAVRAALMLGAGYFAVSNNAFSFFAGFGGIF
jgi:hypothetical protein